MGQIANLPHVRAKSVDSSCQPGTDDAFAAASSRGGSARQVTAWLAASLTVLLPAAAIVLLWRRLAGALDLPLGAGSLLLFGLAAAGAAAVVRWARPRRRPRPASPAEWTEAISISLSAVGLALAVSLPGSSPWGLAGLWLIVAAEEAWHWWLAARWPRCAPWANVAVASPSAASLAAPALAGKPRAPASRASKPSNDVVQQLVRTRDATGEHLSGWLRVELAQGQRTANVHVAFCPPLAAPPEVEVAQAEGPPVRVRAGQVLAHGMRFDLKLDDPCDEPATVLLRFTARAAEPQGGTAHPTGS